MKTSNNTQNFPISRLEEENGGTSLLHLQVKLSASSQYKTNPTNTNRIRNIKLEIGWKLDKSNTESIMATTSSPHRLMLLWSWNTDVEEEEERMERTMKWGSSRGGTLRIQRQQQSPQVRSFQVSPRDFMMTDEGRKRKGRRCDLTAPTKMDHLDTSVSTRQVFRKLKESHKVENSLPASIKVAAKETRDSPDCRVFHLRTRLSSNNDGSAAPLANVVNLDRKRSTFSSPPPNSNNHKGGLQSTLCFNVFLLFP